MEPQEKAAIPATLFRWIGEIVLSIPSVARATVAELIIGSLLAGGGHVTQAFLALTPRRGWQAYHWMLEHGRFRVLHLVAALCDLVRREGAETAGGRRFADIDDTLAPRASSRAPGAAVRFDHARKANRPTFLLCQSFVTLGAVLTCRDRPRCVPVVTGLGRSTGNAGKIVLARVLLRVVADRLGPLCLLLDAWYMRAALIRAALRHGHVVVGQVRHDTALFAPPPPRTPRQRGRPRLYGCRIDAAAAASLPVSTHCIGGYGGRKARLRDALCRPRFLRGLPVRAVWCELAKTQGGWAKQRLLLSTDTALSAQAVVEAYARRWTAEPLFAALKLRDAWERCGSAAVERSCAGCIWSRSAELCWSC